MRIIIQCLLIFSVFSACQERSSSDLQNQENWISLFNGKDLSNWQIKISGKELGDNYLQTFQVQDSMIRISYDAYESFDELYGHMYYVQPFSYYKLRFDYRFTGEQMKGGASWNVRNSGIMFHSQSAASNEFDQDFPVSLEMQLLGGLGEGERTTGNVCTPGTAVAMADTINYRHCIQSSSETYHGDDWIQAEAIILGDEEMKFIIEGDTVLVFQDPQVGGAFIRKESPQGDWAEFGIERDRENWISKEGELLSEGYIALQAESHPIDFKNLILLDLCGCMDPKAKNYRSYFLKDKPGSCQY